MSRPLDFALALLGFVLLFPAMLIIAFAVWITIGRPILFLQRRPGRDEIPFTLVKFRTMTQLHDAEGSVLSDQQRMSRLGYWLRASSLDELPELFNVLRGEMSLVGPRPLLMEYLPLYTKRQRRRHEVRPGLTGWAQINGRNELSWDEKFELDVWYVEHRSFRLDVWILWRTIWSVLARSGISQPGHVTAERFRGSVE